MAGPVLLWFKSVHVFGEMWTKIREEGRWAGKECGQTPLGLGRMAFSFFKQQMLFNKCFIAGAGGITQIPSSAVGFWFGCMRPCWPRKCAQGQTVSCVTLAMDLAQAGSTVESKIYDTLQWQVRGPLGTWGGQVGQGCWASPSQSSLPSPDLDPPARVLHEAHRRAVGPKGWHDSGSTAISERPDLRSPDRAPHSHHQGL